MRREWRRDDHGFRVVQKGLVLLLDTTVVLLFRIYQVPTRGLGGKSEIGSTEMDCVEMEPMLMKKSC